MDETTPAKGFVTIATGDIRYHRLAHALLLSYRLTAREPLPFAVITDRESEYTRAFDKTVLCPDAARSYMDKVSLLVNAPYPETIFIDADCLAYGDLDRYWEAFSGCSDFSCFGRTLPLDAADGWYRPEDLGPYRQRAPVVIGMHGGIYYIRRGPVCRAVYEESRGIIARYGELRFLGAPRPADEPVLALAMALHGCRPVAAPADAYVCLWRAKGLRADFFKGTLRFRGGKARLLHFGNVNTRLPLYLTEAAKARFLWEHRRPWGFFEGLRLTAGDRLGGFLRGLPLWLRRRTESAKGLLVRLRRRLFPGHK